MGNQMPREMPTLAGKTPTANPMSTFTCQEWIALLLLRHRYSEGQDLWTASELAHLRFLRWLRTTHQLES